RRRGAECCAPARQAVIRRRLFLVRIRRNTSRPIRRRPASRKNQSHRWPNPPRPRRPPRLRLQHPPHALRLRRPRRLFPDRRLTRLYFLYLYLPPSSRRPPTPPPPRKPRST